MVYNTFGEDTGVIDGEEAEKFDVGQYVVLYGYISRDESEIVLPNFGSDDMNAASDDLENDTSFRRDSAGKISFRVGKPMILFSPYKVCFKTTLYRKVLLTYETKMSQKEYCFGVQLIIIPGQSMLLL